MQTIAAEFSCAEVGVEKVLAVVSGEEIKNKENFSDVLKDPNSVRETSMFELKSPNWPSIACRGSLIVSCTTGTRYNRLIAAVYRRSSMPNLARQHLIHFDLDAAYALDHPVSFNLQGLPSSTWRASGKGPTSIDTRRRFSASTLKDPTSNMQNRADSTAKAPFECERGRPLTQAMRRVRRERPPSPGLRNAPSTTALAEV